jgi:hypothetical protein
MTGGSITKAVILVTAVSIGIVVLAAVGFLGLLSYKVAVPERMSITGRVTDSAGRLIKGAQVRAVPLPIHDPYSDHSVEPREKERTVFSDQNGRYRFKRLVASGGVKEGIWVQPYRIVAEANGYVPQTTRVGRHPDSRENVIAGVDFVLEKEAAR